MLYCFAEIGIILSIALPGITIIDYIVLTNNSMQSILHSHTLGIATHLLMCTGYSFINVVDTPAVF
ncbi:MAG: hypothetical protein QNJ51_24665 [Calothrix sp. MO_167.B12]|nr:hypothetical protein [Calothrix sp. MO_167.B12]